MSNLNPMKTTKGLNGLSDKSSESWRKLGKLDSKKGNVDLNTAPPSAFRIGGYIRLSPSNEEREEGSLVSHPQRIEQFVESKNIQHGGHWGKIVEWYVDKDLSGKDTNRPAYQKMLRDIQNGLINAVIITELSRLNRKVRDFCDLWEFFKSHNVKLFSLKESFDTSSPMGELMLIQAMSFAQFERQTIVERIKRAARARAERGLASGCLPLGFKLVPNKPNYREIDEDEKTIVELVFRKFLELKRLSHVADYLNANGYRKKEFTKTGKKARCLRWTVSSVHYLLTNRSYIGEREVNRKNRGFNQGDLSADEKYFVTEAHWPALISKELFNDVQDVLVENKKKARKYVHHYRLTGLIVCQECGQALFGKSGNGRNGKHFYYGHARKMLAQGDQHLKRCQVETLPALPVEEFIISRLKVLARNPKVVATLIKASQGQTDSREEHQRALIKSKEQDQKRLLGKHDNLLECISETDDKTLRVDLAVKASEAKSQLLAVQEELSQLRGEFKSTSSVIEISQALEIIKTFRDGFESQPAAIQTSVLKNTIRQIVVKSDLSIVVEIYGVGQDVLDPKGNGNPNTGTASWRSPVRSVSRNVDVTGIEPATPNMPCSCSPN